MKSHPYQPMTKKQVRNTFFMLAGARQPENLPEGFADFENEILREIIPHTEAKVGRGIKFEDFH